VDATVLAGDDGIGRLVLNSTNTALMGGSFRPVAEADQRVDVDLREIAGAGGDARDSRPAKPLAILVVTARPSEANMPRAAAMTNGAAPASIGRVEGKLDRDRLPNVAHRPARCQAENSKNQQACQRSPKSSGLHSSDLRALRLHRDRTAVAPAMSVSGRPGRPGVFCRMISERSMTATI